VSISAKSFDAVSDLFHREAGIRLKPEKKHLVIGRLSRLAQEAGARNLDEYVEALLREGDDLERTRVVDRLTTNETYFFREPKHFEALEVLVRAHAAERRPGPFRVWSAASSSGEEAYSIAMVLADQLGPRGWEVIGTDLSTQVIEAARTALYPMSRIEGISRERLRKWCRRGSGDYEGKMLVAKELRAHVRFEAANLMGPIPSIGLFQVIFLRNVLIYFDLEAKRRIVGAVETHLAPGGLLFTGHTESLTNVTYSLAAVQPAVYERTG
jgi:chemotaxis protein methyltransferase CheR